MPFKHIGNRAQNRNLVYIFKQYFKINMKRERPRHACENYLQHGHRTYNVNIRHFRLTILRPMRIRRRTDTTKLIGASRDYMRTPLNTSFKEILWEVKELIRLVNVVDAVMTPRLS